MDIVYVSFELPVVVDSKKEETLQSVIQELLEKVPTAQPLERGREYKNIEPRVKNAIYTLTIDNNGIGNMTCTPRPNSGAVIEMHKTPLSKMQLDHSGTKLLMNEPDIAAPTIDKHTYPDGKSILTVYGVVATRL